MIRVGHALLGFSLLAASTTAQEHMSAPRSLPVSAPIRHAVAADLAGGIGARLALTTPPLSAPMPGHAHGPRLPDPSLPAGTVKALVLPSWNGGGASAWNVLKTQWPQFGDTPIVIDNSTLGGATSFTYAQLVASGADVLILSNPAGGNIQYSATEVQALQRYARDGHNLIGTYRVFQWGATYNNALAPLFGLQDTLRYWPNVNIISNQFQVLQESPLTDGVGPGGWVSKGYAASLLPQGGATWDVTGLAGAVPVAECDGFESIVTRYDAEGYVAIYASNMPEYDVGTADLQLLYNAITFREQ
jgi:hypothetical protein